MRQLLRKKMLFIGVIILILLLFLHPDVYGRSSYEYISSENIFKTLHMEVAANYTSNAIADCEYRDTIADETTLSESLVDGDDDLVEGHKIKEGGEYAPDECRARFSTAIIVPYRDRAEHLRGFLVYMHMFLRRQRIHYKIYVVEQIDTLPFNRAKLLNIGAQAAMKAGYPCLILHDVDLLPLKPANLYVCTKQPRHMSLSINRYKPYMNSLGGAVSILSSLYKSINGMSNEYYGWGGENEDFYARLEANKVEVCRFPPETSQYHMEEHIVQEKEEKTRKLLESAKLRMATDGLNSLRYTQVAVAIHPLFTHIMVDL